MNQPTRLPPGQRSIENFPRFGLWPYANRRPANPDKLQLEVAGCVASEIVVSDFFTQLARVDQVSAFHCVTTWSKTNLRWSGYRFRDVYQQLIQPLAGPSSKTKYIAFRSQDGYRSCLPLKFLLADDVLLADRLDGDPLTTVHGAPIRLVAPQHYGYMSPKHVCKITCLRSDQDFKPPGFKFMAHPLARVALEERARGGPAWLFRYLYRPLVRPTIKIFQKADIIDQA